MALENTIERPSVGLRLVVFTVIDTDLKVLLLKQDEDFRPALPAWRELTVEDQEPWAQPQDIALSKLREIAGPAIAENCKQLSSEEDAWFYCSAALRQIRTFGAFWSKTYRFDITYMALVPSDLVAGLQYEGVDTAEWFSVEELGHRPHSCDGIAIYITREYLRKALFTETAEALTEPSDNNIPIPDEEVAARKGIRLEAGETHLCRALLPKLFTAAEFRAVYVAVTGRPVNSSNFRRKHFKPLVDYEVIKKVPSKRQTGARPAALYTWDWGKRDWRRRMGMPLVRDTDS